MGTPLAAPKQIPSAAPQQTLSGAQLPALAPQTRRQLQLWHSSHHPHPVPGIKINGQGKREAAEPQHTPTPGPLHGDGQAMELCHGPHCTEVTIPFPPHQRTWDKHGSHPSCGVQGSCWVWGSFGEAVEQGELQPHSQSHTHWDGHWETAMGQRPYLLLPKTEQGSVAEAMPMLGCSGAEGGLRRSTD